MTYKQLERFTNSLIAFYARQDLMDDMFATFNSSYTVVEFCPEITESIFKFIEEDFNDKGKWYSYWFFDLNKGTDWKADSCTEADGTPIVIRNLKELYKFLKKNKKGINK